MIMTEKQFTVKELCSYLLDLIEEGHGDKTVQLSVIYDNCEHIQDFGNITNIENIPWITLRGAKE